MPYQPWYRYADTVGNGTGTVDFNGDYSGAVEQALLKLTNGGNIERVIISVGDTAGMQAQEYGNLGSALTNGIEVKLYDHNDVEQLDLTDGQPVKTNSEWGALCYDVDVKSWGSGNELLVVRWTFAKAGKQLRLDPNWYLAFEPNDDFQGLLSHRFMVQGA